MFRVVLLLLIAACGRWSFEPLADGAAPEIDATACSPAGHDEDGDALDDACDPCPHLAGGAEDADADGVGDACDPSSDIAHDIVFFDPFTGHLPQWDVPLPLMSDQLVPPVGYEEPRLMIVPGRDSVTYAGSLGSTTPTSKQLSLLAYTTNGVYYCELYDIPPLKHGAVYFDGQDYITVADDYVMTPLANEAFVNTFAHTPGVEMSCTTTWPGLANVAGALVDLGDPTYYKFTLNEVRVRMDYVIIVRER